MSRPKNHNVLPFVFVFTITTLTQWTMPATSWASIFDKVATTVKAELLQRSEPQKAATHLGTPIDGQIINKNSELTTLNSLPSSTFNFTTESTANDNFCSFGTMSTVGSVTICTDGDPDVTTDGDGGDPVDNHDNHDGEISFCPMPTDMVEQHFGENVNPDIVADIVSATHNGDTYTSFSRYNAQMYFVTFDNDDNDGDGVTNEYMMVSDERHDEIGRWNYDSSFTIEGDLVDVEMIVTQLEYDFENSQFAQSWDAVIKEKGTGVELGTYSIAVDYTRNDSGYRTMSIDTFDALIELPENPANPINPANGLEMEIAEVVEIVRDHDGPLGDPHAVAFERLAEVVANDDVDALVSLVEELPDLRFAKNANIESIESEIGEVTSVNQIINYIDFSNCPWLSASMMVAHIDVTAHDELSGTFEDEPADIISEIPDALMPWMQWGRYDANIAEKIGMLAGDDRQGNPDNYKLDWSADFSVGLNNYTIEIAAVELHRMMDITSVDPEDTSYELFQAILRNADGDEVTINLRLNLLMNEDRQFDLFIAEGEVEFHDNRVLRSFVDDNGVEYKFDDNIVGEVLTDIDGDGTPELVQIGRVIEKVFTDQDGDGVVTKLVYRYANSTSEHPSERDRINVHPDGTEEFILTRGNHVDENGDSQGVKAFVRYCNQGPDDVTNSYYEYGENGVRTYARFRSGREITYDSLGRMITNTPPRAEGQVRHIYHCTYSGNSDILFEKRKQIVDGADVWINRYHASGNIATKEVILSTNPRTITYYDESDHRKLSVEFPDGSREIYLSYWGLSRFVSEALICDASDASDDDCDSVSYADGERLIP